MASRHFKNRRSRCFKDEDFQEGDVWGSMEDSSSSSRNLASKPRMIPRKEMNPSKEYSKRSSAPVSIPNRQMRMMVNGNGSSWVVDGYDDDGGGVDDDGDDEIVPPHEYIARRLARTQISSFSVCEGVGRKLKGRDLSEVRNDVLRKTGFLER